PTRRCRLVGRRGVEPRRAAVSARCRHRLAHAPRCCRRGRARTSNRLPVVQVRHRLRHASGVVPGALESPPAGFRPAAPPSELQDHGPAREPDERGSTPLRASTWKVKEPSFFASSKQGRRRESNPLLLGYGPSVRPSGPRRRGVVRMEWAEGVEPSPSVWGTDVLSVDTTPTGRGTTGAGPSKGAGS